MPDMNRRSALSLGSVAAASLLGSPGCSKPAAAVTADQANHFDHSHLPPFVTPWSPLEREKDLAPGTTPIRLAAFTAEYMLDYRPGMDIAGKVKTIREAGFTAANSHPGALVRNPWLDAPEDDIRELKRALAEYDVEFCDVHANANNMHPDPAERKKWQQWTYWEMETAERVGAPLVSTHIGSMAPNAIAPHAKNWSWECWRESAAVLKEMVMNTAGMNVVLALEPDPLVQINCIAAMRQIMDECGPRVKICYDPINMMNMGVYYRTTELIENSFDILGEDIVIAHAKDTLVLPDRMSLYMTEVLQGTGELDYETYLVRLSRMKYPRALLIEHIPSEQYPEATEFVRTTAARLGVPVL